MNRRARAQPTRVTLELRRNGSPSYIREIGIRTRQKLLQKVESPAQDLGVAGLFWRIKKPSKVRVEVVAIDHMGPHFFVPSCDLLLISTAQLRQGVDKCLVDSPESCF